jgi:hypothetical protein
MGAVFVSGLVSIIRDQFLFSNTVYLWNDNALKTVSYSCGPKRSAKLAFFEQTNHFRPGVFICLKSSAFAGKNPVAYPDLVFSKNND